MTLHAGTAVWIDHQEARLFHVSPGGFDEATIRAPSHHLHRHPKGASEAHKHPADQQHFFGEVARALAGDGPILLSGPSTAKLQLLRYLREQAPAVESRVVGVETSAHPTDGQLVAHIRHHFGLPDRIS